MPFNSITGRKALARRGGMKTVNMMRPLGFPNAAAARAKRRENIIKRQALAAEQFKAEFYKANPCPCCGYNGQEL